MAMEIAVGEVVSNFHDTTAGDGIRIERAFGADSVDRAAVKFQLATPGTGGFDQE
jgi:hypothetical protein